MLFAVSFVAAVAIGLLAAALGAPSWLTMIGVFLALLAFFTLVGRRGRSDTP